MFDEYFTFLRYELLNCIKVVSVFSVILLAVYFLGRKKLQALFLSKNSISKKQCLVFFVFIIYLLAVGYATLARISGLYSVPNFHLFLIWKEAWNTFDIQEWMNIILNIFLFIPMGILLPLAFPQSRKRCCTIGIAFAVSLGIESMQWLTGRGIFDVDDLFCNTLGAMWGFFLIIGILNLLQGKRKSAFAHLSILVFMILVFSSIFVVYNAKEYGNLPRAMTYRQNMKNTEWILECELPEACQTLPVYRQKTFTKEECVAFGIAFGEKAGAVMDDKVIDGDTIRLMAHGKNRTALFLEIKFPTGIYSCNGFRTDSNHEKIDSFPDELSEVEARDYLAALGVFPPELTEYIWEGDGYFRFINNSEYDTGLSYIGELYCRLTEDGFPAMLENTIQQIELYKEEPVIPPEEALKAIKAGRFSNTYFVLDGIIRITDIHPSYRLDTKGFYQPVYEFTLEDPAGNFELVFIPALK